MGQPRSELRGTPRRGPCSLPDQLHERELAGAIDSDIEVELAFGGLDLGDVDVEIANRISLEPFLRGPTAFDLRQSADAVSLEAAVRRGNRRATAAYAAGKRR